MVSMNSETWQEELYWQNFHFARFTLTLPHDFHHRLVIPKKFTDHMRTQLPEKVVLKVSGVTWNVTLEKGKNDVMLQGSGWQEFAKAYSLKKSDRLMFKYDRHECFEVLLFDQAHLCEKEISYFVRKGQQQNSNDSDEFTGKAKEYSAEKLTDKNQGREDDFLHTSGGTRRRDSIRTHMGNPSDGSDKDEEDETSDEENSISAEDCSTPKKTATKRARELSCNFSRNRNYKVSLKTTQNRLDVPCYKPNKRLVTEAMKETALKKAREKSTQYRNPFIVVMRPSCVYKRFQMTIPKEWAVGNQFKKGEEVILRVNEKTWVCTVCFYGYTRGISAGWKRFSLENRLEEFDVCLFVPAGSKSGKPVLDVSIFRVVSDVAQPSYMTPDDVEVNEISSDDISLEDDNPDDALITRHRKSICVTHEGHDSGRDASNREDFSEDLDESSDEEKSTAEEDHTPREAATSQARQVSFNSSLKRKHNIEIPAEKTTPKENGAITEADKGRALKIARDKAAEHSNSFIAVMKPSSVDRRFFMSITKDWNLRHTLKNGQEVILRLTVRQGKTWPCTFCLANNNVGLQGGWKRFVVDNKLEESDVCLFIPAQEDNKKCVLDVLIFRARPQWFGTTHNLVLLSP